MKKHIVLAVLIGSLCWLLTSCAPKVQIREIDGMPMVRIPAGTFIMGSDTGQLNQAPAHSVRLSAYWIDQYEVTVSQYTACVAAGACTPPWAFNSESHPDYYEGEAFQQYPIQAITWRQAAAYCAWVGGRLPTEAEWEKAARGTDQRMYPWGDDAPDCTKANFDRCQIDPAQVGSYSAGVSPYGLYDMAGNVWEWTADYYDSEAYAANAERNPQGPASGTHRVIRGGSWSTADITQQTTYRYPSDPSSAWNSVGIRCVIDR